LKALQYHFKNLSINFSTHNLFNKTPVINFSSDKVSCCEQMLKVLKTRKRTVITRTLGAFHAHETVLSCAICNQVYFSEELSELVPEQCNFGFDVIVYVGQALFIYHRSDLSIQQLLTEKNISISLREIAYLGKKFIIYLALCHKACNDKLKKHMQSKGGYILHLDGTCEGDSPHLISSIDEISRIVLDNIKMPSENASQLTPYLTGIKEAYGEPIAVVHDMSAAIINAVEFVFPDSKDFICHYHFLRDIGKDLFNFEYSAIRKHWQTHKTRTLLRKMAKEFRDYIEQDNALRPCLENYLANKPADIANADLPSTVILYILLVWVIEAKSESSGYGFPFDRPHLDFYYRLKEAYPLLKRLKNKIPLDGSKLPLKKLDRVLNDADLTQTVVLIQEKISVFDELREIMRIALPEGKDGLNDEGAEDISTIEARVKVFRESDKIKQLASKHIAFKKMVKQIDKYWNKLFADPIKVETEEGVLMIQPQRTNNMLERFSRSFKSDARKKSGTSKLSKILTAMLADTPLVKNLKIPEYMEIILTWVCG